MKLKHSPKCIPGCKVYTSYIRIRRQWTKVGQYHTLCGKFSRIEMGKEDPSKLLITHPESKIDDEITEEIRYLKNLPSTPGTITRVSDDELFKLCSSIG